MVQDYLTLGDWNVMCYECGRKRKASTMVRNWQGYMLCPEHNEERNVQDFVRNVPDIQTPPWVQPVPSDTFVALCGPRDKTAIAGVGTAGCMISGYIDPFYS